MIRIRLETDRGEFVVNGLIPNFLTLPDVIHWGIRTFQLHMPDGARDEDPIYRECFAVALVLVEG